MRIGVYFGDTSPEVGGGFTFQHEVLKALIDEVSKAPQHHFFLMGSSSSLKDYIETTELTSTNLTFFLTKKPNVIEKTIEWLKRGFLILNKIIRIDGPIETAAKSLKLDLVWFVGGGCFETLDTPYIATVWDLQHRLQPWFPEVSSAGIWAARETQYRYFLSRASYVIVGTDAGRDEVELFYQVPKSRIVKLPHPTPSFVLNGSITNPSSNISQKYNISEDFIFYPAQFWAHKNHINLLLAIVELKKKYNCKLSLVLVGSDKGNATYVKKIANKLNITKQIYFLGFVPQSDLRYLYMSSSMLSYISLCGPENLPPLEAFALGCPVLASSVSGSLEQFNDAALFCNPKNPEDIADKIYELYTNDNLRAQLIDKGKRRAEAWTSVDFVKGIFNIADDFSTIRRNWE